VNHEQLRAMLDEGVRLFRAGDYAGSLRVFRDYLAYNPDHADAWWNVARCYEQLGDYPQAAETFGTYAGLAATDALREEGLARQRAMLALAAGGQPATVTAGLSLPGVATLGALAWLGWRTFKPEPREKRSPVEDDDEDDEDDEEAVA